MAPVDELKVDGLSIPCTDDYDCPFSALCYFLDAANPTSGFCGCDAEYGNIGDKCDEPSAQVYARMATLSIVMVLATLALLFPLVALFQTCKRKGLSVYDVRTTTLCTCVAYFVFQILYYSTTFFSLLNPNRLEKESEVYIKKQRSPSRGRSFTLVLYMLFFIASVLNVSILWLEIAIKSKRFKKIANPQISKRYQIAVIIFDIVLALVIFALNWIGSTVSILVTIVVLGIIAFSYAYSAYAVTSAMGSSMAQPTKDRASKSAASIRLQNSLNRIRLCAIRVCGFLFVTIITLGISGVGVAQLTHTVVPKGQPIPYILLSDLCVLSTVCAVLSVVAFIWRPEGAASSSDDDRKESSSDNQNGTATQSSNNIVSAKVVNEATVVVPSELGA